MHPEVVAEKPGTCDKCGMRLVEKKTTAQHHDEAPKILNYNMLKATKNTELPEGEWRTLKFELTGNMNRYVWSINNKTVGESDKIRIRQGENLRIILYNNTMMRHPIHLHGHDFRLLNQYGARSPMKNVVDIMPMETDTLEFRASEEGDWFFHCHILYHMMGGMGRIFQTAAIDNPEIEQNKHTQKMLFMDERRFYLSASNDFAYNGSVGFLNLDQTRWAFKSEWKLGYNDEDGYEVETKFGRYFGPKQWLYAYAGFDWKYQKGSAGYESWLGQSFDKDNRPVARVGIQYMLPWLIVADAGIDHTGHVLVELSRDDIPLSPRLRGSFMVNTDKEYRFGLRYLVFKNFALSANYDNHLGWGAGIRVSY